jgi:hypothetical protein
MFNLKKKKKKLIIKQVKSEFIHAFDFSVFELKDLKINGFYTNFFR